MLPLGCAGAICMDEYDLGNDVATSLPSLTGRKGIVRGNFPKKSRRFEVSELFTFTQIYDVSIDY